MADEIFFFGSYGVKLSDLIAAFALIVSGISAATAIYSARLSRAIERRERKREEARALPRVSVPVVNDDDEGPGPQRHLKIIFSPPENGDHCELNGCELLTPTGNVEVAYGGTRVRGGSRVELDSPVSLSTESQQVNVILHLLIFSGPTVLKFFGVRHDARRSAIEIAVPVPPLGQAHR